MPACMPATSSCRRITRTGFACRLLDIGGMFWLVWRRQLANNRSHETTAGNTEVVHAAHRLCPAAVPCAADRVRRAAHRRSGPGRGDPRQDLRYLPAHRSPQEDRAAGHDRRYRRQEPGKARPVAVAAHPDRRSRHRTDQARRRRDRLRRGVLRAGPAQSGICGRYVPQSRRGDPRQAARAAEQRPGSCRCHQASRASCSANPACRRNSPRSTRRCRSPGSRCWARSRSASCSISRACCATCRCWNMPPPGAACSRSSPSATASSGACR